MNCIFSEYTYPSHDGKHTIYAEIYSPKKGAPKGIIQLAHGMMDHVGRYKNLAEYLTGKGYILAGNHHLGHGKSAGNEDDFGFFADEGGVDYLIADMFTFNKHLRETYPDIPLALMGHSMGSFITRLYACVYPHSMRGIIIHGTAGPNKLLPFGRALAKMTSALRGKRHRSTLITKLAFGAYNSKFPKSEGITAWLTSDKSQVLNRESDKYTQFFFTASAYSDLFRMLKDCNSKKWFEEYPKDMPTLLQSGGMDPVGNYGKGPDYVYKHLLLQGCKSVESKVYGSARHELFNETCRDEVFSDMIEWFEKNIKC